MKRNEISKVIVIALIGLAMGCSTEPADNNTDSDVILAPVIPGVVAPIVIEEEEKPASSSTITLDKNGVKVEAEKVDVEIKK